MERSVSLRPANRQDVDQMFRWRNDPEIYQWFRNQDEPLNWHDHVDWFQSRPDERTDLIIEYPSTPAGVVSLAADGDVGIYIGEKHLWGKGIASEALEKALQGRYGEFSAEIHVDNTASQKLFEKQGFERVGKEGEWIQYQYVSRRWEMENEHGFMQGDGSLHVENNK